MFRFVIRRLAVDHPDAARRHVPGVRRDPHRHRSGRRATCGLNPHVHRRQRSQQYKEANGLTGNIVQQYFPGCSNFVTGNWGASIKGSRPVWPDAAGTRWPTPSCSACSPRSIGVTIGLRHRHPLGDAASTRRSTTASTTGAFVGLSIPPYVSAILLQLLFAIYLTRWLGLEKPLLPTSGVYPPGHEGFDPVLRLKHMILPVTVVAIQIIAIYSRYMRASLLEVKNTDYLRTARAKGISERRVIVAPRPAQRADPDRHVRRHRHRRDHRRPDHHRADLRVPRAWATTSSPPSTTATSRS